jgi:hypothetical protein
VDGDDSDVRGLTPFWYAPAYAAGVAVISAAGYAALAYAWRPEEERGLSEGFATATT